METSSAVFGMAAPTGGKSRMKIFQCYHGNLSAVTFWDSPIGGRTNNEIASLSPWKSVCCDLQARTKRRKSQQTVSNITLSLHHCSVKLITQVRYL
jgi:hypothetical protein